MAIEIRPARPEEYEAAGRVTAEAYREFVPPEGVGDTDGWLRYLEVIADVAGRAHRSMVLVAMEDGRVLGTATIELDEVLSEHEPPLGPGEARLRMLGVAAEARGRGVGQMLLEATLAMARDLGRTRLVLNTTKRMLAAQRLYERNGFVREADHEDDGHSMLSYGRDL